MLGKDSTRGKLTHSKQAPFPHMERMQSFPRKWDVQKERSGVRGKEAKSELPADKNVCWFQEKFSQMIHSRLTHFVTLSLKLERRGKAQPPLHSPDYTPLSSHSLGVRKELLERAGDAWLLPVPARPICNLQSLLLLPLIPARLLGCSSFPPASYGAWEEGPASPSSVSLWKTPLTHARCCRN